MTEAGALQLVSLLALDRSREVDPALAPLWANLLPEIPDTDLGDVFRHLAREGNGYFPNAGEVLRAWKRVNGERGAALERARRELEEAEYDLIAIPPPPEALAAMKRLGLPAPAEVTTTKEGHHNG